jgi:hypothetical protein
MTVRRVAPVFRDVRGYSMVELMVAAAIFMVVAFGMGSMYLFSRQSFDTASTETFLQRQGTLIQEELTRHILRASALEVQPSATPLCRPSAAATIPLNESLLYQRFVQDASTGVLQTEFWCVYRHQPAGAPFPLLYRCPVAGLAPPQNCTATGENLLAGAPVPGNQALAVTGASFTLSPVAGAVATTVDLSFDLDLRRVTPNQSLVLAPRRFSFNTTIRN